MTNRKSVLHAAIFTTLFIAAGQASAGGMMSDQDMPMQDDGAMKMEKTEMSQQEMKDSNMAMDSMADEDMTSDDMQEDMEKEDKMHDRDMSHDDGMM
ncbi:hypothetical protein QQM79_15730 [Marinobacteraceae bacterium S3BR75-40.1]